MTATVTLTLALPAPAPAMLAARATVRTLGYIPSTDELASIAATTDVLCVQLRDRVTRDVLERGGDRLRAVCNYAVGYDNIDLDAATALGVAVTNTPGVLTDATADCTVALILATARRIREGDAELRSGAWAGWAPDHLLGTELNGATLGLIGWGRIAQAVAKRAQAFGMGIVYTRSPESGRCRPTEPYRCSPVRESTLDELLRTCDIVSVHVPLNEFTRNLINAERLAVMKPGSILINTARGEIVDELALVDALHREHLAAAGLDVYVNEPHVSSMLLDAPRTVLTPHLGSATTVARSAMARLVARNAIAVLDGQEPPCRIQPRTLPR